MNYSKIYNDLIDHRRKNPAQGYTENHHIIMKSMGGSDNADNLVRLTGREHWIAHLLLYRIHRNNQSIHACNMMAMKCEERGILHIKNSRLYELIRKHHAKIISDRHKITQKGESNSQHGTKWICNIATQQNQKISKNDSVPDGWTYGRNKWISISKQQEKNLKKESQNLNYHLSLLEKEKTRELKQLEKQLNYKSKIDYIKSLFNNFKNGNYNSVRDFYKNNEISISMMTLTKMWKLHIDEYLHNVKSKSKFQLK